MASVGGNVGVIIYSFFSLAVGLVLVGILFGSGRAAFVALVKLGDRLFPEPAPPKDQWAEYHRLMVEANDVRGDPAIALRWLQHELDAASRGPKATRMAFKQISESILTAAPRPFQPPEGSYYTPAQGEADVRKYISHITRGEYAQESAKALLEAYVTFTDALPAHLQRDLGRGIESGLAVVGELVQMSSETAEALYYLARNIPTHASRQMVEVVHDVATKEQSDWINLKGVEARDPEALLRLVRWTEVSPLIRTLVPQAYVPQEARFEHTWIIGPPGSGKTQLLQYLITEDIKRECSIVVIDSQADLINQVSSLEAIQDRLILIEPGEVALNPFDMKGEQAVDLLTYVFSTLGEGAELTAMQTALYRYCIRLLQEVPEATLITFIELLQPKGLEPFRQYVGKLSKPAQLFFKSTFDGDSEFQRTKKGVSWRLQYLLEDPTFERMFCAPTTKLNLFEELNSNKIILVDTDLEKLGTDRSSLFGRFFIALLLMASQQRASIDREKRFPTFVYIDEAHEYLQDSKVTEILDQARKRRIGMTLANQRSSQITNTSMLDALMTTSIKYVHTDNDRDTHLLAKPMKTTPEFLAGLPDQVFALFVRNASTLPVKVPFFVMENMEHVSTDALKRRMREQYGPDAPEEKPKSSAKEKADTQPTDW